MAKSTTKFSKKASKHFLLLPMSAAFLQTSGAAAAVEERRQLGEENTALRDALAKAESDELARAGEAAELRRRLADALRAAETDPVHTADACVQVRPAKNFKCLYKHCYFNQLPVHCQGQPSAYHQHSRARAAWYSYRSSMRACTSLLAR